MTKRTPDSDQPEEKTIFTKEDVQKIVAEERRLQFIADETRVHGNAFFAESLDHIATLAQRDPFWKKVYDYGRLFKQQFELNTGQAELAPRKPAPAAKEKKAAADNTTADTTTDDSTDPGE